MSFIDAATKVLDQTEAALQSLIAEALKAKAYGDIVTIATMAESVAAINSTRQEDDALMCEAPSGLDAWKVH